MLYKSCKKICLLKSVVNKCHWFPSSSPKPKLSSPKWENFKAGMLIFVLLLHYAWSQVQPGVDLTNCVPFPTERIVIDHPVRVNEKIRNISFYKLFILLNISYFIYRTKSTIWKFHFFRKSSLSTRSKNKSPSISEMTLDY